MKLILRLLLVVQTCGALQSPKLSIMHAFLRDGKLNLRTVRADIRSDSDELRFSPDSEIDARIIEWYCSIARTSRVPLWFHELHHEVWPRRPSVIEIQQRAPPDTPLLPEG